MPRNPCQAFLTPEYLKSTYINMFQRISEKPLKTRTCANMMTSPTSTPIQSTTPTSMAMMTLTTATTMALTMALSTTMTMIVAPI